MPGKFNRLRFDRPQTEIEIIELSDTLQGKIDASAALSADMYHSCSTCTEVEATMSAAAKVAISLGTTEEVSAMVEAKSDYSPDFPTLTARISSSANVTADCYVVADAGETVKALADVVITMGLKAAMEAVVSSDVCAGADYDAGRTDYFSIMGCLVSSATFDIQTITIDATIPPHGRLSIDSNIYTVLLNGDNILHLHSGAWLHMDRDVSEIVIDSGGSGALESVILYVERYL